MKKAKIVAGTFLCMAFLWACAKGQDSKTDLEEADSTMSVSEETAVSNNRQTVDIQESDTAGMAVVTVYDVKGETHYDTRIYTWDGTGQIWIGDVLDGESHSQGLTITAVNGMLK